MINRKTDDNNACLKKNDVECYSHGFIYAQALILFVIIYARSLFWLILADAISLNLDVVGNFYELKRRKIIF